MSFEIKKNVLKKYIPEPSQTEVIVPDGVEVIGAKAFETCGDLSRVILPDSVTVVKQYAFDSFEYKIKYLRVPRTLTEVGKNSFPADLKTAELPKGTALITMEHDSYETTEIITYLLGLAGKDFSAFRAGSRLELALISLSTPALFDELPLAEITKYAKAQKKKLLDVMMDNNMADALSGALRAELISVKSIDEYISLAAGKPEITAMLLQYKNSAFNPAIREQEEKRKNDAALKPLTVTDAKKEWGFEKNEEGTGYILLSYKGTSGAVEIPATIGRLPVVEIRGICNCSYSSKFPFARQKWLRENVIAVHIPEGIHTIGESAFAALEQLKTVSIPESVQRIEKSAFEGCQSLTEICLPEQVAVLEYQAFGHCTGLEKITVPTSVQEIDPWAFNRSPNLTIHTPASSYAETYAKENNIPFVAE